MTGSRKERRRALNMTVKLLKRSTWKCGRVERLIIHHLQHAAERSGRAVCRVADMVRHLNLEGRARGELLDALKRLEKRYVIMRVET